MSKPTPEKVPAERPASSGFSRGMRETIESIAIAFALAFLFKTFQAEAFVIPTGSMAPTLMGRHKDLVCPECGFRYPTNASDEAENDGSLKTDPGSQVVSSTCPNCRFSWNFDPLKHPEEKGINPSYSGDRIWVSKVPYHLMEPRRWDVVVFRFPEEAEKYYIKRLVGLPNETVRIANGDILTRPAGESQFAMQRKPPEKVRAMAQVVYDNDYVSEELLENHWPARWRAMAGPSTASSWTMSDDTRAYTTDGNGEESWIRYHHLVPSYADWDFKRWPPEHEPRPQLITDFYAFNTRVLRKEQGGMMASSLGLHWVGDLILDCELDVTSSSGVVLLDLVKGGRHFRCALNFETGEVELTIPGLEDWQRTAQTAVRGPGKHRVMFGNVDQQLLLWIDDKVVEFDNAATYEDLGNNTPQAGIDGDLAPLGIGSRGAAVTVNHLRVLRDIYYIAAKQSMWQHIITDYRDGGSLLPGLGANQLADFFATPAQWDSQRNGNIFDQRQTIEFTLDADQFFVLGDNSPASSDARLWSEQHYVDRDLLVGKALFVYWPHPLNLWIPFTNTSLGIIPNFPGMGFIR